jgi:hypothetical protein
VNRPDSQGDRLHFSGTEDGSPGDLLVDGGRAGWYEFFDDPLLGVTVVRLWLDAAHLAAPQLHLLSEALAGQLALVAGAQAEPPAWSSIESNRVFPLRGAAPASVLLRLSSRWPVCGCCQWEQGEPDEWFVEELVASFVGGCGRMDAAVDPALARRFVLEELRPLPGWQWWSRRDAGGRSGVVLSVDHEDVLDGRAYVQCVDAVGAHSAHFSCLAAKVGADLGCEVRGEVTVGLDRNRERAVVRRLHREGWRVRGLTSLASLERPCLTGRR